MKPTSKDAVLLEMKDQANAPSRELQDQIRRRAYELYEQRGRDDGHELDDWLQAETELTQTTAKAVAA